MTDENVQNETTEAPQAVRGNEPGAGLSLAEERIGTRITEKEGVGFDPMIIITVIMSLIQGCFKPQRLPTPGMLKQRSLNRARIATALRRETGCSYQQALSRADIVLDAANEATDEELNLLIRDCCT